MHGISVAEALKWASAFLTVHKREERVGELLLLHHLKINRTQLLMQLREPLPEEIRPVWEADVREHAKTGIPLQHLTGEAAFLGRGFYVNKDVLIPRPETEELVLAAEELIRKHVKDEAFSLIDVGTGSGIIATSLSLSFPKASIWASDISERALLIAKSNAKTLGASVHFLHGSYLEPLMEKGEKVQIVISNPPYIDISEKDTMTDTVKNFDPELALFAAENGLAAYQEIVKQLPLVLTYPAVIGFEIGWQQGNAVKQLLKEQFPYAEVMVRQDINGKDRMVFAVMRNRAES